jgi:hypothetical protein
MIEGESSFVEKSGKIKGGYVCQKWGFRIAVSCLIVVRQIWNKIIITLLLLLQLNIDTNFQHLTERVY